MDRSSLLELTQRELLERRKTVISLQPPQYKWTLLERLLGYISPPGLDTKLMDLTDTWDYHYRTNRTGRDYPTPDETATVVRSSKPKPRSSVAIFELHITACRACAEAKAFGSRMCVVGAELQRRMDRDVFYRRPSEYLLRR